MQLLVPQSSSAKVRDPKRFYQTGATPSFAARGDQRFSYCLYVPAAHETAKAPLPLVVLVHGTGRTGPQYRDAFADFAEQHGCVVLAPLFPAGIIDPDDLHNFKFLEYRGIRFDQVLLDIVAEVGERYHVATDRFLLQGFSGGGQFTHRFFYLHPERLAAVSIGAPGRITLLDPEQPWWLGTAGFADRFGKDISLEELRKVKVQLVVGAADVETWEINNVGDSNWMDGAERAGRTRVERLHTLYENYRAHGIDARIDLVPGVAHDGMAVLDTVRTFLAEVLAAPRG